MNRRDFFVSSLAAAIAASLAGNRALAAGGTGRKRHQGGHRQRQQAVTLGQVRDIDELRASLRGALLLPGQPGYDEARRVLNASIDKHPALVVQPSGTADVRTAVSFAREHDLCLP